MVSSKIKDNFLDLEKLLSLLDKFPDGLVITDEVNMVILANKVAQNMFGFEVNQVIGERKLDNYSNILWRFIYEICKSKEERIIKRISFPDPNQKCDIACWEYNDCQNRDCPLFGKASGKCWRKSETPKKFSVLPRNSERRRDFCPNCPYYESLFKFTVEADASKIFNQYHKVVGTVIVIRDITKLKELERLKDRFISNVSHELRTPVSIIRLYSSNFLNYYDRLDEDKKIEFVEVIDEQTLLLQRMIENLLSVVEVDTNRLYLEKSKVDFSEMVNSAVKYEMEVAKLYDVHIYSDLDSIFGFHLRADEKNLQQAIIYCLDNAVKYNNPGGEVIVKGYETIENGLRYKGINIIDNGIGIPNQDLNKIFDSFYRSDTEKQFVQGVGLGLTIAKAITESHNGKINIQSEFRKGTQCQIIFPVPEEEEKILVIDDDVNMLTLTKIRLKSKGYTVITARSGKEALLALKKEPANLIIIDLMMPEMSGQELLQKLRSDKETRNIPAIVVTAKRDVDTEFIRKIGADDFLVKPFSTNVLCDVVNRFIGQK